MKNVKSIIVGMLAAGTVLAVSAYSTQIWSPVQFVEKLYFTPGAEMNSSKATIVLNAKGGIIKGQKIYENGKEVATKEDLNNVKIGGIVSKNGKIGIGTTNLQAKLDVGGDIQSMGDIKVGYINPKNTGRFPGYGSFLRFYGGPAGSTRNSDNSDPTWIARYNVSTDHTELRINVGDNREGDDAVNITSANGSKSLMYIKNNGNVGIKTTNPSHTLEVNGTFNSTAPYLLWKGSAGPNALIHLNQSWRNFDALIVYSTFDYRSHRRDMVKVVPTIRWKQNDLGYIPAISNGSSTLGEVIALQVINDTTLKHIPFGNHTFDNRIYSVYGINY